LTSFGREKDLLSSCEIRGEVCYLFAEKIHVHQKVTFFMGVDSSFFQTPGLKNEGQKKHLRFQWDAYPIHLYPYLSSYYDNHVP
jgi:hypothetical protein